MGRIVHSDQTKTGNQRGTHMSEKNITRRKEVDIEITDFLWEIIRNWRVIGICLIAGAVLLCGYQYRKDIKSAGAAPEEVVETYNKTLEEMEASLGTQDLDQVYGAMAIRKQLDEKSSYAKNSPLMAINPYEEAVVSLQYCVKSESGNAAEISEIYQDYILNGDLASELISCSGQSDQATYVKNTYETGFTVKILGKEEADSRELAETVKSGLDAYARKMAGEFSGHEVKLVNETFNIITDQNLAQLQDDTALAIKNLSEHLDTIKSKLNGNQLELYIEYTENQPDENQSAAEEVKDNPQDETQSTTSDSVGTAGKSVHISVSKLATGGILGAVLAIIYILLKYLFTGKLRSDNEIKTLYHNDVLGTIRSSITGKRNKVDQWYVGARYGRLGQMTLEQEVELICANIKIACKENKKVYITGSNMSVVSAGMLEKIQTECKKRGIQAIFGDEISYHAKALEEMADIGQVVFMETMRKSRYNDMYQEVIRCRELQIPILGTIVIGA